MGQAVIARKDAGRTGQGRTKRRRPPSWSKNAHRFRPGVGVVSLAAQAVPLRCRSVPPIMPPPHVRQRLAPTMMLQINITTCGRSDASLPCSVTGFQEIRHWPSIMWRVQNACSHVWPVFARDRWSISDLKKHPARPTFCPLTQTHSPPAWHDGMGRCL